jgi:tetratricopeptide (TPR) repeat protein
MLAQELALSRRLALLHVPSTDGHPVDRQLGELQARAERDPGKVDTWVLLGRAWVRKARESGEPGYYRNADACAQVALDLAPESSLALDLRGLVLLNEHRFAEARALAEQTLRRDDRDVLAHGIRSDALLELGDYDGAVDAAQRMMALKPNLPSYARASYLAWLRGDATTALMAIRQAIDASPMSRRDPEPRAWALTQAAQIFWHRGDYQGAEAGFVMAEQSFPGFPPALVGRGRVALSQGRARDAAALLARAYAASPLPETAWLLGDARLQAGDEKGAQAAYEQAIQGGRRSDPRTLSLLLSTLGRDLPEALRLAEEERRKRGDTYTVDAYAFALYRAGRAAEARAQIDQALRLGTPDARLLYHGGAIHLASGDVEGGKAMLRRALQLNPKFDLRGAADAARLLASS